MSDDDQLRRDLARLQDATSWQEKDEAAYALAAAVPDLLQRLDLTIKSAGEYKDRTRKWRGKAEEAETELSALRSRLGRALDRQGVYSDRTLVRRVREALAWQPRGQ